MTGPRGPQGKAPPREKPPPKPKEAPKPPPRPSGSSGSSASGRADVPPKTPATTGGATASGPAGQRGSDSGRAGGTGGRKTAAPPEAGVRPTGDRSGAGQNPERTQATATRNWARRAELPRGTGAGGRAGAGTGDGPRPSADAPTRPDGGPGVLAGGVSRMPVGDGGAAEPFTRLKGDLASTARGTDTPAAGPRDAAPGGPRPADAQRAADDASAAFTRAADTLRREASDPEPANLELRAPEGAEAGRAEAAERAEIAQTLEAILGVVDAVIAYSRTLALRSDAGGNAGAAGTAAGRDRAPARRGDLPGDKGRTAALPGDGRRSADAPPPRDRGEGRREGLLVVKVPIDRSDALLWEAVEGNQDLNRALAIRAWQAALRDGGVEFGLAELARAYDRGIGVTTARSQSDLQGAGWGNARTDDAWRGDILAAEALGRDTIEYGILTPPEGIQALYDKLIGIRERIAQDMRDFLERYHNAPDIGLQAIAAFYTAQVNAFINLANAGVAAMTAPVRNAPRLFGGSALPSPGIPKVPYFGEFGKRFGPGLYEPCADIAVMLLTLRPGPGLVRLFSGPGVTASIVRGGTRVLQTGVAVEATQAAHGAANHAIEVLGSDAPFSDKLRAVAGAVAAGTELALLHGNRRAARREADAMGAGGPGPGSGGAPPAGRGDAPDTTGPTTGTKGAPDADAAPPTPDRGDVPLNEAGDALSAAADRALKAARGNRRPAIPASELGTIGTVSSRRAFRREVTRKVAEPGHPLGFLLGDRGKLRPSTARGTTQDILQENPDIVEAAHVVSARALTGLASGTDRFVVMTAQRNRVISGKVEHPSIGGHAKFEAAIEIGGVPVDPQSAAEWVAKGDLPAEVLANARRITF